MVADTFIGLITNQISTWLGDNPTVSIGLGITGLALVDYITGGKIYNSALKAYDFLKDYLQQAYQIVTHFAGYLTGYVSFITSTFEVDNPRKTFYLSLIFLLLVYGLIFLFSGQSWSQGGITEMEKKQYDIADFSGVGAIGSQPQTAGDQPPVTTTTLNPSEPPPDLNYTWINMCQTDADCDRIYGEGINLGYKCCYPSTYAGYACQGQCLSPGFGRDACKHPTACYNANGEAALIVLQDATNCVNKATPNSYCDGTGDYMSLCCDAYPQASNVCYGYCTRANSSHLCNDYTACLEQFEGF